MWPAILVESALESVGLLVDFFKTDFDGVRLIKFNFPH